MCISAQLHCKLESFFQKIETLASLLAAVLEHHLCVPKLRLWWKCGTVTVLTTVWAHSQLRKWVWSCKEFCWYFT